MTTRLIALGASNLARGMGAAVAAARQAWGPQIEVVSAFGPGRSYGMDSSLAGPASAGDPRMRPVVHAPRSLPPARTRAIVTDVGNDILYHVPVPRIVSWVDETLARLGERTDDVVLTGLPLERIRLLSPSAFLFFRSILVPACRLSQAETLAACERVDEDLRALAERRGARFVPLPLEWYGRDPVHIRPAVVGRPPGARSWRAPPTVRPAAGAGRRSASS